MGTTKAVKPIKPEFPAPGPLAGILEGIFASQAEQMLAWAESLGGSKADVPNVVIPDVPPFRLGALKMSERVMPSISLAWGKGESHLNAMVDLDADEFRVRSTADIQAINDAAFAFCQTTNESTSLELSAALDKLRAEINEGVYDEGEAFGQVLKRIQAIFDKAPERAALIAQTELIRAYHAGMVAQAQRWGGVAGWEWLVSEGSCPTCIALQEATPKAALGSDFAAIGNHPIYSKVQHPPAHPGCRCSMLAILTPEFGGPESPDWPEPFKA